MRKILLSLAVAFGMQAGAQTDTVMYRHFNNGTIDTASISTIDSKGLDVDYLNKYSEQFKTLTFINNVSSPVETGTG